jgi:NADH-quinone oxidoreductase subunit C
MKRARGNSRESEGRESVTILKLKEQFFGFITEIHSQHGDDTVIVPREKIVDISRYLKEDPELDYNILLDITAVDYLPREPRFEVVYHYLSLRHLQRIRVKVRVTEHDPEVSTLTDLWDCANWLEREVWDMFGIRFEGHPDLRRILMYEEFEGHPLRKDYPIRKRQPLIGPKD